MYGWSLYYCLCRHGCHSDAVVLLNKAIKEEKNEYGLYLNRGGGYGGIHVNTHYYDLFHFA